MFGIGFDQFDKFGDKVVSSLELDVNIRPGGFGEISEPDVFVKDKN